MMVKTKDILHPIRQVINEKGHTVKCPICQYDRCKIMGAGTTPVGINPRNLELECGNCRTRFYEFITN